MEFINVSSLAAGYTMATDNTGREWLVLVAKASFGFPPPHGDPILLPEQVPLVMADEFAGEPSSSPPRTENDFAPRKPMCDVVLNGSCHAPQGRPATKVPVGLRVGGMSKAFLVVGHRRWESGVLFGVGPGKAEPYTEMPVSYANAYGGVDRPGPDPETHHWYETNPVGLGFRPGTPPQDLDGQPLPNTEELGQPVERRNGDYAPMSFGPLGRSWRQRIRWAGTYDSDWKRTQYPFLPRDFDDRYFQCAPEDQQVPHLRGGEPVVLLNLTPEGRTEFTIPRLAEPFDVVYKTGERKRLRGVIDTLFLEPDLRRFTLTLRASFPLRRSVHELCAIEFGRVAPQPVPPDGIPAIHAAKRRVRLSQLVAERQAARRGAGPA